jgi:RimJ/RimL family protein N-acetyltransferase
MSAPTITTPRLLLRHWRDEDVEPFRVTNADPRVMEHFPSVLSGEQSDTLAERISQRLLEQDFGFWAVEVPGIADFIGFIGLSVPGFASHFTPCVEIGWRLAAEHWGRGYASEGASAALGRAFGSLNLKEVVSFTVPANRRSIGVMERIGMVRSPADDFDRPWRPDGSPFQRHVLYRIRQSDWLRRRS